VKNCLLKLSAKLAFLMVKTKVFMLFLPLPPTETATSHYDTQTRGVIAKFSWQKNKKDEG